MGQKKSKSEDQQPLIRNECNFHEKWTREIESELRQNEIKDTDKRSEIKRNVYRRISRTKNADKVNAEILVRKEISDLYDPESFKYKRLI